ncbi:MIEAP protein, partial [Acrocephalus arundinaceus]|nr:MIEAP protein [Acrocephalus arundinaceus]
VPMGHWSAARMAHSHHRDILIDQFNFLYSRKRLAIENLLKKFVVDLEMVQRIIYIAALESFHASKKAFKKLKRDVKEKLAMSHCSGPESLDYIACHEDLYYAYCSVPDVICSMNGNLKLPCAQNVDFNGINCFIPELCCLAFLMQTLIPPLEVTFGVDGELFDRSM